MAQKWHTFSAALLVRHTLKKAYMDSLARVSMPDRSIQRIAAYRRTKGSEGAEARPDQGAVVAGLPMLLLIGVLAHRSASRCVR